MPAPSPLGEFDINAAAKDTEVDMSGLGAGPSDEGLLSFVVGTKGKNLPEDYKYASDIFRLPEYDGM